MTAHSIKQIAVYGGGRWARSLVTELRRVLPVDSEIVWVTKNCFVEVQSWLNVNPVSNVRLVSEWLLDASITDGIIIATSPQSHYQLVRSAIERCVPTLCEKPIAASFSQLFHLLRLSEINRCPVGVHLEFLFAGYLHKFAERIKLMNVCAIHLDWLDPWSEERDGHIKYGEFYSDIVSDQLPHCWSVLTALLPGSSGLAFTDIHYSPDKVMLNGTFGALPVSLNLSRRSQKRVRLATVIDDQDSNTFLDFSIEPGVIKSSGQLLVNQWSGNRPLACSLGSFVDVVRLRDPGDLWPLELKNCSDALLSSLQTSQMLKYSQDKLLDQLLSIQPVDLENPDHVNLIVDRFLPDTSPDAQRFYVRTLSEQKSFASAWLSSLR